MKLSDLLFVLTIFIMLTSCEKKDSDNRKAELISVTLDNASSTVDSSNNKVILKIPESTDVTKIVPHFSISPNATIYPPSDVATNFSNPVVYTITSGDGLKQYIFTVSALKQIGTITVYDCSNWTPSINRTPATNTEIKVYLRREDVNTSKTFDILTTDQNAKAELYGQKGIGYFITINKDNKSNIVNGYIIEGRYNNQAEVDAAFDQNAIIGGFKYKDMNGDGRVWPDDRYNSDLIYFYSSYTGVKLIDLYIASVAK